MPRNDPHAGKYPPPPLKVCEPGTPEHEAFVAEAAAKRQAAEKKFDEYGAEIGRPKFW